MFRHVSPSFPLYCSSKPKSSPPRSPGFPLHFVLIPNFHLEMVGAVFLLQVLCKCCQWQPSVLKPNSLRRSEPSDLRTIISSHLPLRIKLMLIVTMIGLKPEDYFLAMSLEITV